MSELELLIARLAVDEDDAAAILQLCDHLDTDDAMARFGYPKDTPRGRDLAARIVQPDYLQRLRELARDEGLPQRIIEALK